LNVEKVHCKGDPELALSKTEMVDKARDLLLYGGLCRDDADGLINQILGLPKQQAEGQIMDSFLAHVLR